MHAEGMVFGNDSKIKASVLKIRTKAFLCYGVKPFGSFKLTNVVYYFVFT
jgi:hypothetical protein